MLLSFFKNIFIFGCAGSLLLCRLFSSCGEQGLLFTATRDFLIVVTSLAVEHRLRQSQHVGSVVGARRL